MRIPEISPISELARDARRLVARARERLEPIVVTQRGRDVAVLMSIELYRELERRAAYRIVSPRLVRSEDAEQFKMVMSAAVEQTEEDPAAGV